MFNTVMVIQKVKKKIHFTAKLTNFVAIGVLLSAGLIITPLVKADNFDAQINAIKQDTAAKNDNLSQLGAQAVSLQDQIAKLQDQINVLQGQINANTAKSNDLQAQITAAEAELTRQRKVIGESIRSMYLEGQISTLEMLASSKDLSEFVDKQQYRDSVQNKIKDTLDKINILKSQLNSQKAEVEQLLKDQQNMQAQVSAQQAQQAGILALNQSQQSTLNSQIQQNNAAVAALRAAQAAANRRFSGGANVSPGDPNHGGYPSSLANAPQDSRLDPWGMYNRECVSYAAWKVYQTFGHMPYWGGHGNANQWPQSARNDGIPTGSTPRAHSVAIWMIGTYGHAMWVESVNNNNTINVSQFNYDYNGTYSEMTISASNITYIYFN